MPDVEHGKAVQGLEEDILTIEETAALMQVSPKTITRWVKDGIMPETCYQRQGRRILHFSRPALMRWVGSGGGRQRNPRSAEPPNIETTREAIRALSERAHEGIEHRERREAPRLG